MSARFMFLFALACAWLLAACDGAAPTGSGQSAEPPTAGASRPAILPSTDSVSGLPTVRLADLPPEAAATVTLIAAGGPFPYRQDGAVFENREGILPDRPSGSYHEYTVPTPGSSDRGARRIVTGADGEMYWTADHYDSFSWIAR